MPNITAPEWLLSRLHGRDRASAILGDLLELSATRGRLWFWIAYTRTLISLGWRAPVAFAVAYVFSSRVAVAGFPTIHALFHSLFRDVHHTRQAIWYLQIRSEHLNIALGNSLIALWFILPFVLVRFGLRDRLTHLASALFLLTLPFFSLSPEGVNFACLATVAMILTAMFMDYWRVPMIVLAASLTPLTAGTILSPKIWHLLLSRGYGFSSPQLQWSMALYRGVELITAAIMCSFLYRRLLQIPADGATVA